LKRKSLVIVRSPAEVRDLVGDARKKDARIGFVPTMGALHEGHMSLIRLGRDRSSFLVASIFVNPKQFGPKEDYGRYPRDEAADAAMLEKAGCDLLFAPSERDLYSSDDRTRISVGGLDEFLCGSSRPGHFNGVALVVTKLFNIVQPDEAYFGQKDAQQAVIIQRLTADLDLPVRIVVGPTVREEDGLAMSSRNRYLGADDRARAVALYEALMEARNALEEGERAPEAVKRIMVSRLIRSELEIDYAEVVDASTLRPVGNVDGLVLIAVAARLEGTRLIDNIVLRVSSEGVEESRLEFPEWSRYGWKE
jgi:pantoate--beta-alanine ligase